MKKKNIIIVFCIILVLVCISSLYINKTTYSNKIINVKYLVDEILNNNSIVDSGTGLYRENDEYYFKENVVNNYVLINEDYWRIIMIDSNKDVLLIKDEGINNNKLYMFNEDYSSLSYDNVDKILNNWYKDNLENIDKYVLNNDYCIMHSETCLERKNNKISLLNGDIVDRIGFNNLDYLINDVEWWLILDSTYDEFVGSSFVAYINDLGNKDIGFVDEEKTLRPIITLKNIPIIEGEGTMDNPYKLSNE